MRFAVLDVSGFQSVHVIDSLDPDIGAHLFKRFQRRADGDDITHTLQCPHDGSALLFIEDRPTGFIDVYIIGNGHHQHITHSSRGHQVQQMAVMKEIKAAVGENNFHSENPLARASS